MQHRYAAYPLVQYYAHLSSLLIKLPVGNGEKPHIIGMKILWSYLRKRVQKELFDKDISLVKHREGQGWLIFFLNRKRHCVYIVNTDISLYLMCCLKMKSCRCFFEEGSERSPGSIGA